MFVEHVILKQHIMEQTVSVILDFMETEITVVHVIVLVVDVQARVLINVFHVLIFPILY